MKQGSRFDIRWDSPKGPLSRSSEGGDPRPELPLAWNQLAAALLLEFPDRPGLADYLKLGERKVNDFLEGRLDPVENPMDYANQLEDVIQALEIESQKPSTP